MKNVSFLLMGCALFPGCKSNNAGTSESKPPNVIFILTDDQRWDALGYAGNNLIQTPEMDRLAREGVYFKNAFITTPICAASRASILTGLYERTHGYTFQQGPLKKPYMDISYPVILRQNDYYTGFYGKLGVDYTDAESLFDKAEIFDRSDKYTDYRGFFYKTIGKDTVHLTHYTGYRAKEFLDSLPEDRPFCLSLSFSAPHAHDPAPEQFFWQEKSDEQYSDITFPPPGLIEDEYFNALPKEVREGFNRVRWYWRYDTPEKYQHSMKGYYRMISEIDDEIGKLRKALQEKGLAENTVIIFMSDNGYFTGERQLAGKWLMYEESIHVPLIIYDPRAKKHQEVSDMVLNIDVPFTILDLAGIEVPSDYQGISLTPYLVSGKPEKARESILVEHLWNFDPIPSSEGLRTKKWKYFRYQRDLNHEELYDLENDPDEMNNLASLSQHLKILEKLRIETDSLSLVYEMRKK